MAVPEQIPVVNYVADGVVKKFDVPFEYDQQSDLHIYVDGIEPTIDKYFFEDNAFNFYIAPTVGQDVKIKRITPKERDTDYNLHTNTVRPKALNSDFDRLWYVLQEVFSDVGGLSQAVQDEIIARIQGDEDLLNQLTAEISARMLGDEAVTEDLKNYVNQVVGTIIGDPSFSGIDAKNVNDASGQDQQQVNYNGGSKWHTRIGGYKKNEIAILEDGSTVKSTIDGNTNNPNTNMTGWSPVDKKSSVNTIAELSTIVNPKNWDVVFVKSYYEPTNLSLANPYKGGGRFIYVSGLSNLNDGVSVIDGWVRDLSSKLLTTDDAGLLGDGTDINATVRLQNLFNALGDGFTVQAIGKYTINRHVMAYNKKDLKIVGVDSDIQGDPDNWTWDTTNIVPDVPWYHPRGMLMAYECPSVHFDNLKIKGINRPNRHAGADQWQDGDCSIMTYKCDNATFSYNDCTNNFAWGICNENGNNGEAYGNTVSYCTHQSGINICNGSNEGTARVYNNHVSECGLYGIEYENRNTYEIECYSNTAENCYAGVMALSDNDIISGKIYDNTSSECLYGVYPTNLLNEKNELTVSGNTVINSEYAINFANGKGVNIVGNILNGFYTKDTYLHISPSSFIAEVLAPNQLLTHKSLVSEFGAIVGSVYYVEGQQITVTAIVANTVPWSYGNTNPDEFIVVTIAESILNEDFLFMHLKKKYAEGARCFMGINDLGANKNNIISGNTFRGFAYGFVKDHVGTDAQYDELIAGNTFIDGATDVLNPASSMGVKYLDNNFNANLDFNRNLIEQGNITLEPIISQKLGIARSNTGVPAQSTTIYLPQTKRVSAIMVSAIGASTTGKIRVTINGNMVEAQAIGTTATISCNFVLNVGANTVTISDSVGDLTYTDVFLSLLSA